MQSRKRMAVCSTAVASIILALPLDAQTSRDSAGVRIVENARPAWTDRQRLQLAPTPRLFIGNSTDSAYRFSWISGVVRLSDGRVVVADEATRQLRFFGADGRFISASGGKGTAPGQLQNMGVVHLLRGDTIAVSSSFSTLSYYTDVGRFVRSTSLPAPNRNSPIGSKLVHAVLRNGMRAASPLPRPSPHASGAHWADSVSVQMFDQEQAMIRDLGPLPYIVLVQGASGPYPPWLSSIGVFSGGNQRLYAGFGDRYAIQVYGADGTLQSSIRRSWKPVPVTPADWETWVVEWSKLWVKDTGAAREKEIQKVREQAYAETLPAFSQFLVDRVGRLWVREAHWQDAIGAGSLSDIPAVPSEWSVFDTDGRWLGDVRMPADFQPYDIGADYVAGKAVRNGLRQAVIYALSARGR